MFTIYGISRRALGGLFISLPMLTLFSCSSEEEGSEEDRVHMPVNLYIPAKDMNVTTSGTQTTSRAAGDPGTYENFELPTYAYIYVLTKDENSQDHITLLTEKLKGAWTKKKYDGAMATANDSVYQYDGYIDIYLPTKRQAEGKVYAALSSIELTGLPTGNEGTISTMTSESEVQNMQFTMSDAILADLQNIYSTPYNYKIDGTYYGTLSNMDKINPSINIMLYHIASKLDILWNVPSDIQSSVKISKFTLSTPHPTSCYIFKPLENTASTNYDQDITVDAGNQWYGRAYRYVIPVADSNSQYTFSVTLTNGNNSNTKSASITTPGTIDKTQPFTPWILGTLKISSTW